MGASGGAQCPLTDALTGSLGRLIRRTRRTRPRETPPPARALLFDIRRRRLGRGDVALPGARRDDPAGHVQLDDVHLPRLEPLARSPDPPLAQQVERRCGMGILKALVPYRFKLLQVQVGRRTRLPALRPVLPRAVDKARRCRV